MSVVPPYEFARLCDARFGDGSGDRVDAELAVLFADTCPKEGLEAGRMGRRRPALEAGRRAVGVLAEEGSLREAMRVGLGERDEEVWGGTRTQLEELSTLGRLPGRGGVVEGLLD
jgi:hypothetical protein